MSHSSSSVTVSGLDQVSAALEKETQAGSVNPSVLEHPAQEHEEKHHHQLERTGSTTAEWPVDEPTGETDSPLTLTPQGTHDANFLVAFHPGDPDDPKNWSNALKWNATLTVSGICFVVAFASSVITAAITSMAEEMGVSDIVALLSVSLFVIGFGIGTLNSSFSLYLRSEFPIP
jgi:hypothetical protein